MLLMLGAVASAALGYVYGAKVTLHAGCGAGHLLGVRTGAPRAPCRGLC